MNIEQRPVLSTAGTFKITVSIGMAVRVDRFILHQDFPETLEPVAAKVQLFYQIPLFVAPPVSDKG
jgi:hypothetical protein